MSFFIRSTAKEVWKSVTGVSSAGKRRGRGKGTGRALVKDYNRGQDLGVGPRKLVIPGLNAGILTGSTPNKLVDAGDNPAFDEKIKKVRAELSVYRKYREAPLERGWSGKRAHGRRAGQPEDHNETSFDNFDSICLMMRSVNTMTGTLGRTRRMHALVVTGNKNGLAGFSTAIGKDGRAVVRHARNRASQVLVHVPRWENHTVMHDFFSRYYFTTVFVERKPKGYGIRAPRIIKAICEMFGITDIYAKSEGTRSNPINLTKAFFLGLMNQKKYEDIAEEKKLHLVELREENFFYPNVLASPKSQLLTDDQIRATDENLDFTYYIYDGRIKEVKSKRKPFYEDGRTWYKHLDKMDYIKNRQHTKLMLAAKYGNTKVLDVFPHFKTNAASFNKPQE